VKFGQRGFIYKPIIISYRASLVLTACMPPKPTDILSGTTIWVTTGSSNKKKISSKLLAIAASLLESLLWDY